MKIEFGKKYRDSVTGFEGVATGRSQYMTGCEQILLEPLAQDGKPAEHRWVDIDRIEGFETEKRVGGPRAEAPVR